MGYKIKLEKFEGPLDLLLNLIEEEKLAITEVSLAQVTEQFIGHLEKIEETNPEELADFLVVAAKLLLIKSKILLPVLEIEDEDGKDLEKKLKIYKEYLEASVNLNKMILRGKYSYARESMVINEVMFLPPKDLTGEVLRDLFSGVIKKLEPIVKFPEERMRKTISIREKISELKNLIFTKGLVKFQQLVKSSRSREEVIVNFLALLELVKQRTIAVKQDNNFHDIIIEKAEISKIHNQQE